MTRRRAAPGRARVLRRLAVALAGGVVLLVGVAPVASAHPLGNATVNHYDGLTLYPDRVTDRAIEDIAEIPTVQRRNLVDTDRNATLSDGERSAYATAQCTALARADDVRVNGRRLSLQVSSADYSERPGAIGLKIGRLVCQLQAKAELSRPATVAVSDRWDSDGIGWHEITAIGTGVSLRQSPFPQSSVSGELLTYPNDLLSSPLNVRDGSLDVLPGSGASTYAVAHDLPVAGVAVRALNRLTTTFNNLVGAKHITVGVGLLAVLLSMLLGAGHAFLPGHGKTIMAAYLVGRRGRVRDVVMVGATVTTTHTAGVLVLGLVISVTTAFAPTAAEQALGVLSGLIVAAVGAGLFINAVRRRHHGALRDSLTALTAMTAPTAQSDATGSGPPDPPKDTQTDKQPHQGVAAATHPQPFALLTAGSPSPADSQPDQEHGHDRDGHDHDGHDRDAHDRDGHDHDRHDHDGHDHHGHDQDGVGRRQAPSMHSHGGLSHTHTPGNRPFGRGGLVGLGVAGGLVPSPSALLVLLAANALGRTVFGVVVVLAYGLGMATALSVAGLLLVRLRHHATRLVGSRLSRLSGLSNAVPFITASLVLVVGCWLALRAAGGTI